MLSLMLRLMIVLLVKTRHELCQLMQNRLQFFQIEPYKFEKFLLPLGLMVHHKHNNGCIYYILVCECVIKFTGGLKI